MTDEQTCKTDRQRRGLSAEVHSYEEEYSWSSPPFYFLLVFTLVSFLVDIVHECRSAWWVGGWVGRDPPPILTSPPIPRCILISPELLNQCKTNTICQGSMLPEQGLWRLADSSCLSRVWLIRLAAVDGCCSRLCDIFRNPPLCPSLNSRANEGKSVHSEVN